MTFPEQIDSILATEYEDVAPATWDVWHDAQMCREARWDYDTIHNQPMGWFGLVQLCWAREAAHRAQPASAADED